MAKSKKRSRKRAKKGFDESRFPQFTDGQIVQSFDNVEKTISARRNLFRNIHKAHNRSHPNGLTLHGKSAGSVALDERLFSVYNEAYRPSEVPQKPADDTDTKAVSFLNASRLNELSKRYVKSAKKNLFYF